MTQKLLDRAEISRRLTEIDKLSAISPDTVPIEKLPSLIDEQTLAAGERDRLLIVLKQLDKRESSDAERDRVASIQQEIQKLTVESNTFQASLPEKSKQIEALAIVYAESLSKLQTDGRRANFAKSRIFYLQRQLEGKHIERFDQIPVAVHLPPAHIALPILTTREGIEFHTGSSFLIEATTIERVLEDKSLGATAVE